MTEPLRTAVDDIKAGRGTLLPPGVHMAEVWVNAIAELRAERDRLAAENERLRERLAFAETYLDTLFTSVKGAHEAFAALGPEGGAHD